MDAEVRGRMNSCGDRCTGYSTKEEENGALWRSGELFEYYHDWLFHVCQEDIFDCNSGGIPHKHCMDTLIAQKMKDK